MRYSPLSEAVTLFDYFQMRHIWVDLDDCFPCTSREFNQEPECVVVNTLDNHISPVLLCGDLAAHPNSSHGIPTRFLTFLTGSNEPLQGCQRHEIQSHLHSRSDTKWQNPEDSWSTSRS